MVKRNMVTIESIIKEAMPDQSVKLIFKGKMQCHKCHTILPISIKLDKEKFING